MKLESIILEAPVASLNLVLKGDILCVAWPVVYVVDSFPVAWLPVVRK